MPVLSVLMPVYNSEQFLEEAITSILQQTFRDFEFLILDDASTDGSLVIIKKYQKKDKRIKIFQNSKNQGEGFCRGKLMEQAKAEIVAWMDADDISLKHRLKTQLDFMKKNPRVSVVSCRVDIFGSENYKPKIIPSDFSIKSALLIHNPIVGPASMIRKNAQKYSYNKKVRLGADYCYWIDNINNFCYANLPQVLYKYRMHSQSLIKSTSIPYDFLFPMMKSHLKKFSIILDKEDFYTILGLKPNTTLAQIKKSWKVIQKILTICNFYGYSGVDRKIILKFYFSKIFYKNFSFSELCQCFLDNKTKKKEVIIIIYKIAESKFKKKN